MSKSFQSCQEIVERKVVKKLSKIMKKKILATSAKNLS
jgi:hypothetical protein